MNIDRRQFLQRLGAAAAAAAGAPTAAVGAIHQMPGLVATPGPLALTMVVRWVDGNLVIEYSNPNDFAVDTSTVVFHETSLEGVHLPSAPRIQSYAFAFDDPHTAVPTIPVDILRLP